MNNNRWLAVILTLYLVLGVVYSLSTPPLEASDEFKHYPYTQYVQAHHDLPVLDPQGCRAAPDDCPWLQDGGQPPLYYVLMAAFTSWIDTSDVHELRQMNWHAFIGDPAQVCNKNLVIHHPQQEAFPWHGAVLAIHLIRFATLLMGAGTVLLTYLLSRRIFAQGDAKLHYLALGAAALTAFNPMFLFVSAAANNDGLAAFLGCLTLLLIVRLVYDGLQGPLPWWRYGILGLVIGLFILAKLSGLAALILLGFLLLWLAVRRRSLRPLLLGLPIVVALAVLLSGWWFLRNWQLYGDPTALNAFVAIQGVRSGTPTLRDWLDEFGTFRWTYWGLFGAVDVMAPRWVYTFFDLLSLAGTVGLGAWAVRRRREAALWWIPLLWVGVLFVSVLRWTWIYFSFQGRLIFPAIAGISPLLLLGLWQWVPTRRRPAMTLGLGVIMALIAAALPFVAIRPAYRMPQPLALDDVPPQARVEPVDVGGGVRVVGWELAEQTTTPGGEVRVVVYWEALAPDGGDYVSFVRLLGREHALAGDVNRRPACGMIPTDQWQAGQVWRDPYLVRVAADAVAPSRMWVEAGLYDPAAAQTLGVVPVGQAKLAPVGDAGQPQQPLAVELADGVALRGYDLQPATVRAGEVVTLTLYWEARARPTRDYTVFVHLLDQDGELVAVGDGPPLDNYYPTGMWAGGESIADPHRLVLPDDVSGGTYQFVVGMYDLETMARLPRTDGAGDAISLPVTLTVER